LRIVQDRYAQRASAHHFGIIRGHRVAIDQQVELFVDVFGELGRHARAAIGCSSLPRGSSVEVEAIFAFG